jgi:hypothetical protein
VCCLRLLSAVSASAFAFCVQGLRILRLKLSIEWKRQEAVSETGGEFGIEKGEGSDGEK